MIKIAIDLNDKLATLNQIATPQIADKIDQQMKDNTATGKAFGNDRYDNQYVESYKKVRSRAGVGTSPVTMRFKSKRIEQTNIETTGTGSTISFADDKAGVIFKYHHDGIDYKRVKERVRSIFPKSDQSVPQEIRDFATRIIGDILRGR